MLEPRNTLVVVAPLDKKEKKVGNLVIPHQTSQQYQLCDVIAVGPGMVTEKNEMSTTRDLKVGQKVLVQTKTLRRMSKDHGMLEPVGVDFTTDDGRAMVLVDQSQIVAIVGDETPDLSLTE